MKRKMACMLTILMMVLLLTTPVFAQEKPDAFALTVDDIKVTLGDTPTVDIGLALNANAGINEAGERGIFTLDLSGADQNVLTLIASMEEGMIKAYARNALGGMPYVLTAPVETLKGMAPGMQSADADQFSGLQRSAQALVEAAKDPAYREALNQKLQAALQSSLGLTEGGDAEVELFGEALNAQTRTGQTDFAGLLEALPAICAADPALKALYDEAVKAIDEGGALGKGVTIADLPARLAKQGNEIDANITLYETDGGLSRLEVVMTAREKGVEAGAITLTLDSAARLDHQGVSLGVAIDFADEAQADMWASVQASQTARDGGTDGHLAALLQADGEDGGTFAFELQTSRDDATAERAQADEALLTVAFMPAGDEPTLAAMVRYAGETQEADGAPTADGTVTAEIFAGNESLMNLSFHLQFQRTRLGDGTLFKTGDNPLEDVTAMTEEQLAEMSQYATAILNNSFNLLLQDPGVAALLAATLGGNGS